MNFAEAYLAAARAIRIDHATELHDMIRPESWLLLQELNVNVAEWFEASF